MTKPIILSTATYFVDGHHKHGGAIYATTVGDRRVTLGVVRRQPKTVTDDAQRYLVNDWTLEPYVDGQRNEAKVSYYPTRAQAMAHMEAIYLRAAAHR